MGLFKKKKKELKIKTNILEEELPTFEDDETVTYEKTIEVPTHATQTNKEKKKEQEGMKLAQEQFLTRKILLWDVVVTPQWLRKKEPLLFYITEENQLFLYYNIKPGQIQPKDQYGKKKENIINEIHPRKMLNWSYGDEKIRCYVHYEKEKYSYPHEPVEDAKRTATIFKNIQSNYKNYDESTNLLSGWQMKDIEKYLWIVGGTLGILLGTVFIGNVLGVWETLGWVASSETTIQVATNVTKQNVSQILGNGVIIN